ncbi:MAG: cache domain-containing protein [Anaerolineae bacterium]
MSILSDLGDTAQFSQWTSPLTLTALGLLVLLVLYSAWLRFLPHLPVLRRTEGPPIGRRLRLGFALTTILPLVSLTLVLVDRAADRAEQSARVEVAAAAAGLAATLDERLESALDTVAGLAAAMAQGEATTDADYAGWLMQFHSIHREFISLAVADTAGRVLSWTVLEAGAPVTPPVTEEMNVSDRSYFRQALESRQRFLSDAFRGRGLDAAPIAAVSAPVLTGEGNVRAVVQASLDFAELGTLAGFFALTARSQFLILDGQGQVVVSSQESLFPTLSVPNLEIMADPSRDQEFLASRVAAREGWTVLVRVPRAVLRSQTMSDFWVAAAWFTAALVIALLVGTALTRQVATPLQNLVNAVRDYLPPGPVDDFQVPREAPEEIRVLGRHIQISSKRMTDLYLRLFAMRKDRKEPGPDA